MSAVPEQIHIAIRFCIVYAVVLAFFVLNTVSLSLPISGSVEIPFSVMVIYYWSIYRPRLLPPVLVFGAGIVFDAVSGLPLGLSAFVFLGLRWLVVDQRLFLMGQSFMMVWMVFAAMSAMCLVFQWFMYGVLNFQWTPILSVMFTFIAGFVVFPIVNMVLNVSHRLLPSMEAAFGVAIK
jgi:rod shape-determining protein MreD